jgi:hypothetical protein
MDVLNEYLKKKKIILCTDQAWSSLSQNFP